MHIERTDYGYRLTSKPAPHYLPPLGDELPVKHSDPSPQTFRMLMIYSVTMIVIGAVTACVALR